MKTVVIVSALLSAVAVQTAHAAQTMRVDFYHTGNAKEERFALDRVVVEPLQWPGNPSRPIDDTNRGKYFFEVIDQATSRVLYSRGFSSIYGEWETTGEAQKIDRTFEESLRFPAPAAPVRIVVRKRDARNGFRDAWTFSVDPADKFVLKNTALPAGALIKLHESGPPDGKLDFLILGDGYTAAERGKFERDARRLVATLLQTSPFKERQHDINIWGLVPAAAQSGISRPSQGIYKRSPVGATYDAFDSERYVLSFENKAFRDLAANAPYEVVEVLTNTATYGGGGIYGLYSTVAADSVWAPYIFVHEFGHHIAALADEVLHIGCCVPAGHRSRRAVGTQRDSTARSSQPEMEGSRNPGHAVADRLAQGRIRGLYQDDSGPAPADSRRESTGIRDGCVIPRAGKTRYRAVERRRPRASRRRVRGRQLRGARLLPPRSRLHHVHPRQRAILRGVPKGDRADS